MINLFVFNLKHFAEGIISSNEDGITLKLSFIDENNPLYEYVFIKDTYSEKYLNMTCSLLGDIYQEMKTGGSNYRLNFNPYNLRLCSSEGYIFDRVIINRKERNSSQMAYTEYKLS
jgi:hypothetical protein